MNAINPAKTEQTAALDATATGTDSLSKIVALLKEHGTEPGRTIPPVDQWNPARCGSMNLTVKANGEWWHEGSKITREALIKLFASVLWREPDGTYYLKTPVEKLEIEVEDVPLLVTRIEKLHTDGKDYLSAITQTGDVVVIDAQHPVFLRDYQGEMRPYVKVRWDLEALIQRSAFYHLLNEGEFVEQDGQTVVLLNSGDFGFQLNSD